MTCQIDFLDKRCYYLSSFSYQEIRNKFPEVFIENKVTAVSSHWDIPPLNFMLTLSSSLYLVKVKFNCCFYSLQYWNRNESWLLKVRLVLFLGVLGEIFVEVCFRSGICGEGRGGEVAYAKFGTNYGSSD